MKKKLIIALVASFFSLGALDWDNNWGRTGGTEGGGKTATTGEYTCDTGSWVDALFGHAGGYVDLLYMRCSNGKILGPVGWQHAGTCGHGLGGNPFYVYNAEGFKAVVGRAGGYVDHLIPVPYGDQVPLKILDEADGYNKWLNAHRHPSGQDQRRLAPAYSQQFGADRDNPQFKLEYWPGDVAAALGLGNLYDWKTGEVSGAGKWGSKVYITDFIKSIPCEYGKCHLLFKIGESDGGTPKVAKPSGNEASNQKLVGFQGAGGCVVDQLFFFFSESWKYATGELSSFE